MENGFWKMENGKWKMDFGKMKNEKWRELLGRGTLGIFFFVQENC
jgi:hypothetical protein